MNSVKVEAGTNIAEICSSLTSSGYSAKLCSFSAIDKYLGLPPLPYIWLETNADIAALARLVENLRFPGLEIADGAVDTNEGTCYFRCLDLDIGENSTHSFPLLSFSYDWQRRCFQDPLGFYPLLKDLHKKREDSFFDEPQMPPWFIPSAAGAEIGRCRLIMDGALLLARYGGGSYLTGTPRVSPALPRLLSTACRNLYRRLKRSGHF